MYVLGSVNEDLYCTRSSGRCILVAEPYNCVWTGSNSLFPMLSDSSHVGTLCSSSVHGKWDSVCDIGAASFRSIGIIITHGLLTHQLSTTSNYCCFMVMLFINFV